VKSTFEATGGTQTTGDTQTTGGGQAAPPDPGQQDTGQTQPTGETQPALPGLDSFIHLNTNGNLVIDCQAASDMLAQLNQRGETEANDQSELIVVQMLAQLCADSGFTPSGAEQPSDSTSSGGQQA
jgi:hypothetical protein